LGEGEEPSRRKKLWVSFFFVHCQLGSW
jgi:hypothetical protein